MIDPLRFVPTDRRVNDGAAVADSEIIYPLLIEVAGNSRPRNALTGVLDDALAFPERFRREHAAAVHA